MTLCKQFNDFLCTYQHVFIHVDKAQCHGLPALSGKSVCLQIGLNMAIPVYPLIVDEKGLDLGLSFSERKHQVFVPWKAIAAIIDPDRNPLMINHELALELGLLNQKAREAKVSEKPKRVGNVIYVDFRRVS